MTGSCKGDVTILVRSSTIGPYPRRTGVNTGTDRILSQNGHNVMNSGLFSYYKATVSYCFSVYYTVQGGPNF